MQERNTEQGGPGIHGFSSTGLPAAAVVDNGNGERLTVTYRRRKAATNPGLTFTPQFASSLDAATWTLGSIVSITDLGGDFESVVAEDIVTTAGAIRRFGKIMVQSQ